MRVFSGTREKEQGNGFLCLGGNVGMGFAFTAPCCSLWSRTFCTAQDPSWWEGTLLHLSICKSRASPKTADQT